MNVITLSLLASFYSTGPTECPYSMVPITSQLRSSLILGTAQQSKSNMHPVPTPTNSGSQIVKNIGLITGVATTIVLVLMIIVLTLIVVGAITMCRRKRNQHKNKSPIVSNEACGTITKNLAAHKQEEVEEDTYDYVLLPMNQQVMESINTIQNEAYLTNNEVIQSMSHYH